MSKSISVKKTWDGVLCGFDFSYSTKLLMFFPSFRNIQLAKVNLLDVEFLTCVTQIQCS